MATEAGRVFFTIGADSSEADKKVGKSFAEMAKSAVKLGAAIFVAKKAFDVITTTFRESIDAASLADSTTLNMAASFARAGEDVRQATDDFLEFADTMQSITGISDEVFQDVGVLGASFGLVGEDLKRATIAATDLAKVMGTDVKSAMTRLVASVERGVSGFARYGITMTKTADKGERLDSLLGSINAKFGGAALAAAQSYGTRIKVLGQVQGDLSEELGRAITQSKTWNAWLVVSADNTRDLQAALKDNKGWLEKWVSGGVNVAATGLVLLVDGAGLVAKAFQGIKIVANVAIAAVIGQFDKLLGMVEATIGGFSSLLKWGRGIGLKIAPGIDKAVASIAGFREEVRGVGGVFQSSAKDGIEAIAKIDKAADGMKQRIIDTTNKIHELARTIEVDPVNAAANMKTGIAAELEVTKTLFQQLSDELKENGPGNVLAKQMLVAKIAGEEEAAAFKAAQDEKIASVIRLSETISSSLGRSLELWVDDVLDADQAWDKFRTSAISAIRDMAVKAINAYAATSAAAAFSSQAWVPGVGILLGAAAATAAFAAVTGYLTRFHEGGIVGGRGREQIIVAEKNELILPVDVTRELLGGRAMLSAAGAGGGGDTFNVSFPSVFPQNRAETQRSVRELTRVQNQVKRRGFGNG